MAQLREFGLNEGQNIAVEYRNVDDPRGPFAAAADLMRSRPDLIVASGPEVALQAVVGASLAVPIVVIAINYDPIGRGYVAGLARPGGNITGVVSQQLLSRRGSLGSAGKGAAGRLHRQARRADRGFRQAGRRSRINRAHADHLRRARRQGQAQGEVSYAELEPYKGPDGSTTVLSNTIFSTVPGAPVFVGKATRYRSKHAKLGHDLDMTGHNALQSTFVFDA